MRTLYVGLKGDDVLAWEHFLLGREPSCDIVVDGEFSAETQEATIRFQKDYALGSDGIVGPRTMGVAMQLGFNPLSDSRTDESTKNWPAQPPDAKPMTVIDRQKLFGTFSYKATPVANNPEAIDILGDWEQKNILTVNFPQLVKAPFLSVHPINGAPKSGNVQCHKLIAPQLVSLFQAWEDAGLMKHVMSWGGLFVPRFVRGSRTSLSNHSWGTAFDINVQWNGLGTDGALKGEKGSVRELVEIAYSHGFFWGGWYAGRKDPMHFEACRVL